ncbi:MAG: hypothetical protein KJ970_06970 [Candidatus Eisenbacteria bacterium]|uniref:SD-repeat containing protein B domain-containing protein n=1 Tax=Eiseniibacteriota bacterium TaxID=2212470 RepID=A0A948W5P9_UNCEI|nr:hypothetical protein [Candidatus Eisenbacteria bacterium]
MLALILGFAAKPAQGRPEFLLQEFDQAYISGVQRAPARAGDFFTCSYQIENLQSDSLKLQLEIDAPDEWVPVTGRKQVVIPAHAIWTIPFTLWVPSQASADSLHKIIVRAQTIPEFRRLENAVLNVEVAPTSGMYVRSLTDGLEGEAGSEVKHLFELQNTGNRTDVYHISALSIPLCETRLSETKVRLEPGESRQISATMTPPDNDREKTLYILELKADQNNAMTGLQPVHSETEVLTTVYKSHRAPGRYKRLPLNVMMRMGATQGNQPFYGIRFDTKGNISPSAQIDMEADFTTETQNPGITSWKNQRFHLAWLDKSWKLNLGDVHREYPDVTTKSISARGVAFEGQRGEWTGRFLAGKGRMPEVIPTWGAGIEYGTVRKFAFSVDYVRQGEEGVQYHKDDLTSITARFNPTQELNLRYETGFSRTRAYTGISRGNSGLFHLDYQSAKLKIRGRTYYGSDGYTGWAHNRDGVALYSSFNVSPFAKLWMNVDSSRGRSYMSKDSPESSTSRIRFGGRILTSSWPGVEITAGSNSYESEASGSRSQTQERDMSIMASHNLGPILATAMWKWGLAENHLSGSSGRTNGLEFNLGWQAPGWHVAFHLNDDHGRSTVSDNATWATSLSGDVAWNSWRRGVTASLMFASRWVSSVININDRVREDRVYPKLGLRLGGKLWLSSDAGFRTNNGELEFDRWQVRLTFSSAEALPVVWSPVRGGVRGVVFLDEDMDGYPDLDEERIEGVILLMEGSHRITDRAGQFDWEAMNPGIYWLDLNQETLPSGYFLKQKLPLEVHVSAGNETQIAIPLTRGGEVSGLVFKDDNHNGARDSEEGGVSGIRMVLTQEGTHVAEWLTDNSGMYKVRDIPSARYQIRIADNWLPSNWVLTGQPMVDVEVGGAKLVYAPSLGIAPRIRPIVTTYQSGFKKRLAQVERESAPVAAAAASPAAAAEPEIEEQIPQVVLEAPKVEEEIPQVAAAEPLRREKTPSVAQKDVERETRASRETPEAAKYLEAPQNRSSAKESPAKGPLNLTEVYDSTLQSPIPAPEPTWQEHLMLQLARLGIHFMDGRLSFNLR